MIKVQLFGIAKEFVRKDVLWVQTQKEMNVAELREWIMENHPSFKKLPHFMIAVNQAYALDQDPVSSDDEIAIIPPVSGG